MNFRHLRVINHDFIAPEMGFGTHPHRNMEIITYILKGKVAHKDSMGNETYINAGEVQVMSAGRGVAHSEFNPLNEELELLQIWVTPQENGLEPSYDQKTFTTAEKKNKWAMIISPDGGNGSLKIHQDVRIYATLLDKGATIDYELPKHRYAWIQVAQGEIEVNGQVLSKGDGLSASFSDKSIQIKGLADQSDILLFDLN
jgi:redox-sensitive bicupin YhaK (pirin superfamily)